MRSKIKQKKEVTIMFVRGKIIKEKDIQNFKERILTALKKSEKMVINMAKAVSKGTEWQIANSLCELANEAERQQKKIAIACLPSEILSKANEIMLGRKIRIFYEESAAVNFLNAKA